jgi:predicted RNase H-like HicB family nuclease
MNMLGNYTATYARIDSGYMGQLVEWPEVITEGRTLEECREMLKDALHEMVVGYLASRVKKSLSEASFKANSRRLEVA